MQLLMTKFCSVILYKVSMTLIEIIHTGVIYYNNIIMTYLACFKCVAQHAQITHLTPLQCPSTALMIYHLPSSAKTNFY